MDGISNNKLNIWYLSALLLVMFIGGRSTAENPTEENTPDGDISRQESVAKRV